MTRLVTRFIANLFLANRAIANAMARTFGSEPALMAKALETGFELKLSRLSLSVLFGR